MSTESIISHIGIILSFIAMFMAGLTGYSSASLLIQIARHKYIDHWKSHIVYFILFCYSLIMVSVIYLALNSRWIVFDFGDKLPVQEDVIWSIYEIVYFSVFYFISIFMKVLLSIDFVERERNNAHV